MSEAMKKKRVSPYLYCGEGTYDDKYIISLLERTMTDIKIPNGTKKISSYALSTKTLKSVDMPDSIEQIDNGAFLNCQSLSLSKLPENLKIIGDQTFFNCMCISISKMPINLQAIGVQAFANCTGIKKVYFYSTPTLKAGLFANCNNITDIYVPWSSGEVANAPWGAENATIHYDTLYDSDGEPIN